MTVPDDRPQVSWKAIEVEARVISRDGEEAGRLSRVVGDENADVFTGLAIHVSALGGERFVAAERVVAMWPDRVQLDLSGEEIRALPSYEEPPVVRWRPGAFGGIFSRLFGGRRRR